MKISKLDLKLMVSLIDSLQKHGVVYRNRDGKKLISYEIDTDFLQEFEPFYFLDVTFSPILDEGRAITLWRCLNDAV